MHKLIAVLVAMLLIGGTCPVIGQEVDQIDTVVVDGAACKMSHVFNGIDGEPIEFRIPSWVDGSPGDVIYEGKGIYAVPFSSGWTVRVNRLGVVWRADFDGPPAAVEAVAESIDDLATVSETPIVADVVSVESGYMLVKKLHVKMVRWMGTVMALLWIVTLVFLLRARWQVVQLEDRLDFIGRINDKFHRTGKHSAASDEDEWEPVPGFPKVRRRKQ